MPHVLVAGPIDPAGIALLDAAEGVTYEVVPEVSEPSYAPLIHKADALVLRTQPMTEATTARAGRLKIVSRHGVGYDAVDVDALTKRGIALAIVGDVNSRSVAEHALWMMMSASRLATRADRAVREDRWGWRNTQEPREIFGKSLLILGYGRIGRRLAEFAAAFGMTVTAFDPVLASHGWPEGPVRPVASLADGLRTADFVSIHAPKAGAPLIGRAELALMKPTAVIVNTSRGGIVDEAALAEALTNGTIRAAGLDVFEDEPPSPDNPLFKLDNVVLSPHIAGLMREGFERLATQSVQNVLDFFAGRLDPGLVVNGVPLNGEKA